MANPQVEDGYTQIANEILDHLVALNLPPNHWRVLLFVIRKTYGYKKKVDYIANFQIVGGTGLCKAVVSRALHDLSERRLIIRSKRLIGFQKDWEQWQKLAESSTSEKLAIPSTLATKLAEQQTIEKLAKSSTKLAKSSTKVSSCAVTQKKKENIQKKETTPAETFEDYKQKLRQRFNDLDFDLELEKFNLYWTEGKRKLKNPKLALFNWLTKAREIKLRGNGDGTNKQRSGIPGNRPAGAFADLAARDQNV